MFRAGPARIVVVEGQPTSISKVVIIMGYVERAEALFLSDLQPSQHPTPDQVDLAIEACLRERGPAGCAAAAAEEYGEHPDLAAVRMRWALEQLPRSPSNHQLSAA